MEGCPEQHEVLLPVSSLQLGPTAALKQSQHFTLFLSLAAQSNEDENEEADPAFKNFLQNVEEHDLGLFTYATRFINHGATFTVRRTIMPEHRVVVFKSTIQGKIKIDQEDEALRLGTILLELRVLTHPPLRKHRNIINLLAVGWEGDAFDHFRKWPVLVVEYADRGTLVDYFDHETSILFPAKQSICLDVASGLHALHACGIVHGDLKLENVLVVSNDPDGSVVAKLSDFGGALLDSNTVGSIRMPTLPWNAPEWRVERPRKRLLKSDVYSLGLLIWRIALNGDNPFEDGTLFASPQQDELEEEKKNDGSFLSKAKCSISQQGNSAWRMTLGSIFDVSIRTEESSRDLPQVLGLLSTSIENNSSREIFGASNQSMAYGLQHDEPVQFSFVGLQFTPLTMALRPKILESMAYALSDTNLERKQDAAYALTLMNLSADYFGLIPNVDRGLNYLVLRAMLGSLECGAWVLRLHEAFGRQIPDSLKTRVVEWLVDAAATGSMTAIEDLREHDYTAELQTAVHQLRTRYCGIGDEIFGYSEEVAETLVRSSKESCHTFISTQMQEGRDAGQDISGYLLRLAASYGSVNCIEILIADFAADLNDCNSRGETPLLFAARSGHLGALLVLIELGADPELAAEATGDIPLHWLCSFDDEDIPVAVRALVKANVNAQALEFPNRYVETEFVAGTPLHRAVARDSLAAVKVLLDLGANPYSSTGEGLDDSPFALAVSLHYPHMIRLFLQTCKGEPSEMLILPSGKSILISAMDGGSVSGNTMGRLIRHGRRQTSREEETFSLLFELGARSHIHVLPGYQGCTAAFYASQCHVSVLDYLLNHGAKSDIDKHSERLLPMDGEESSPRPPIFEAIMYGKVENVQSLLKHGADPLIVENASTPNTILSHSAHYGFQELDIVSQFLSAGVGVDSRPVDVETPFACAVLSRGFVLAEFLREKGADVNALFKKSIMGFSFQPITVLNILLTENSPGSLSCIEFLFRERPGYKRVSIIVEPARGQTVFHILANLVGDVQDKSSTISALSLCHDYFEPTPEDLNQTTLPYSGSDFNPANTHHRGGNTALHHAVVTGNLEVVKFLLESCNGVDTSVRNGLGLIALDVAVLHLASFEETWQARPVPKHPSKQKAEARSSREEVLKLLEEYSEEGVTEGLLEEFTLH